MKTNSNCQKGLSPLLIPVVLSFIMGGLLVGGYIQYKSLTQEKDRQETTDTAWKKYSDAKIEFEYPKELTAKQVEGKVELDHSIPYKHGDTCDFKGDSVMLEKFLDLSLTFEVVDQNLQKYVESSEYPGWEYVSSNPIKIGNWSGYKVMWGIEGCGNNVYYLTISPTKTLVVSRYIVTEFNEGERNKYLGLPGIINPNQEEEIFTKMLMSLKVKNLK